MGFFDKLKSGLAKTRNNITVKIEQVFGAYKELDDDFFDELEEALIIADVGVPTASYAIETLRKRIFEKRIKSTDGAKDELRNIITELLDAPALVTPSPCVLFVVGVNGVGKTTTIGKLAARYKEMGKSVMLCAADTFRAAAADQLEIWAGRAGVPIVRSNEGADPASVVFDGIKSAKAKNCDMLIIDTAGRLQNKSNLMKELSKMRRIIDNEYSNAQVISLLVLDATVGQNGLVQAQAFKEAADIVGVVLTKLDGTAKGGSALAIKHQLGFPIRFIGVGEHIDDLQVFNAKEFVDALF
ncbi:MAG: signal recognition particle-docking protein FtsY [Clostridiales bacterium]|nr:signal recognition particle-docking protein FtsY [Clostridiales bacterium]MBQ2817862.1 signal recognition particle-docking protein FtsY [Clostridia bacterium]MBQ4638309.1 signal recognition particle-docking protein FtsY [Clostridia bacterium]